MEIKDLILALRCCAGGFAPEDEWHRKCDNCPMDKTGEDIICCDVIKTEAADVLERIERSL